jgi:CRP-like cAMP-binding protein
LGELYRLTSAGDEVVIDVLTKGESLAVAVAFTRRYHPVTAEAISDSRVLEIPVRHVVRCMGEAPEVALAVLAATSVHRLVQQVVKLPLSSFAPYPTEFVVIACMFGSSESRGL